MISKLSLRSVGLFNLILMLDNVRIWPHLREEKQWLDFGGFLLHRR